METIIQALAGIVMLIATAAIPILVPAMLKRWNIANDADLSAKLQAVALAGAGVAYNAALRGQGLDSASGRVDAVKAGAAYVTTRMPDTMAALGVSPAQINEMDNARLGTLLASDPTVTAGHPR